MNSLRTAMRKGDLRVIHGPSSPGPAARALDRVVGVTKHERFLQGLAEGLILALEEGVLPARIVEGSDLESAPLLTPRQVKERKRALTELREHVDQYDRALESITSEVVRRDILKNRAKAAREADAIEADLSANEVSVRQPRPESDVEVRELLYSLADIAKGSVENDALRTLLHGLRPVAVGVLDVHFQTEILLPGPDDDVLAVGPIRFSVENIRRHPEGIRSAAMVKLILDNAWPVSVVAPGIPFRCRPYRRDKLAGAFSSRLTPLIGSKAASVVAGCEVPEVLAVLARHLRLANPDIQVEPHLERRIVQRYIEGGLPSLNSWIRLTEARCVWEIHRRVRESGPQPVDTDSRLPLQRWEARGWLKREGDTYVDRACQCGSEALALIPTPEVDGLVCLDCRKDTSGLYIPQSWNVALIDRASWEQEGRMVEIPDIPGLPETMTNVRPLPMR